MVVVKSNSHPDLLVFASGEEGRIVKAVDDENNNHRKNNNESSLEYAPYHHVDDDGDKQNQQQQQEQPYYAKATTMERSCIGSLMWKLLLAKKLSVHANDKELRQLRETHEDILAWICLEDLRHCHQSLIQALDKDKDEQQQPHVTRATNLELSYIGSLLEELQVPVNATDDDLQRVKETHPDILYWISLDDLRRCHQTLVEEKETHVKPTQLEMSFIGSMLWKQLPSLSNVTDEDLQAVKDSHGDILSWISLDDLRLCLQYH